MNLKNLLTPLPPVTSPPTRAEYPRLAFYAASLSWWINQVPKLAQALIPPIALLLVLHLFTIHGLTGTFMMQGGFIAMIAAVMLGALDAVDWVFQTARAMSNVVVLMWATTLVSALYVFGWSAFVLIGLGALSYGSGKLIKAWVVNIQATYRAIRDIGAVGKAKLRQTWTALQLRPLVFSFGPAVMMATAATEHRPRITVHQEQGGSDSDDANGNHHADGGDQNRDEPHHEGQKLTWVELLAKLEVLRAEFYAIKEAQDNVQHTDSV